MKKFIIIISFCIGFLIFLCVLKDDNLLTSLFSNRYIGTQRDMLGYHAHIDKGISRAIECSTDADAIQIFFRSPQRLDPTPRKILPGDIEARNKRKNLVLMSHSPYVMNLATSKLTLQSPVTKMLFDDLRCNDVLGGIGTVIHLGSNSKGGTKEDAMKTVVDNINFVVENYPANSGVDIPAAKLILENNARAGNKLFWEVDSLPPIASGGDGIGYCLDTQHLFASGYNVGKISDSEELIKTFDRAVGKKRLSVIHINDSAVELDGRKDEHAVLGHGKIWHKDKSSLSFWVKLANDLDIPMILETGKIDHGPELELLAESFLHGKN